YFRRWHRDKANSGGLFVHKSSHHFDLVNWWTGQVPERVDARGGLGVYGRDNAEARGADPLPERGPHDAPPDPFAPDRGRDAPPPAAVCGPTAPTTPRRAGRTSYPSAAPTMVPATPSSWICAGTNA